MSELSAWIADLDRATTDLGEELQFVKSSLDLYELIAANIRSITVGREFFLHTQRQSHVLIAIGLVKLYERKDEKNLFSISGVCGLLNPTWLCAGHAHQKLSSKYGVEQSACWHADLLKIRKVIARKYGKEIGRLKRIRNSRLAHLENVDIDPWLPSIHVFEQLLIFGIDIHSFIKEGFLNTVPAPIARDSRAKGSITAVLKKLGITDIVKNVPNI